MAVRFYANLFRILSAITLSLAASGVCAEMPSPDDIFFSPVPMAQMGASFDIKAVSLKDGPGFLFASKRCGTSKDGHSKTETRLGVFCTEFQNEVAEIERIKTHNQKSFAATEKYLRAEYHDILAEYAALIKFRTSFGNATIVKDPTHFSLDGQKLVDKVLTYSYYASKNKTKRDNADRIAEIACRARIEQKYPVLSDL